MKCHTENEMKWQKKNQPWPIGHVRPVGQVKIRIFSQPISSLGVAQSTVGDLCDLSHYLILCDYSYTDLFRAIESE